LIDWMFPSLNAHVGYSSSVVRLLLSTAEEDYTIVVALTLNTLLKSVIFQHYHEKQSCPVLRNIT